MTDLENNYDDEIMVLKSIYEDKLEVAEKEENTTTLSMMLYPSTAEDIASQYVKFLLELTILNNCPDKPVQVNIKTSRGISDEQLRDILTKLREHAQSSVGSSVLFDLIELAKDSLTSNNLPSCPCPICMANFQEIDDFFKTECYHYLHSYCMHQYVLHWKNSNKETVAPDHRHIPRARTKAKHIPCPVCRNMIPYDLQVLSTSIKPVETQSNDFDLDSIKKQVKKMDTLYKLQKEKGGIIDLEAEKNKCLLSSIEQAHAAANSSSSSIANETREENSSDEKKEESCDVKKEETSDKEKGNLEKSGKQNQSRNYHYHRHYNRRQNARGSSSSKDTRTRPHSGQPSIQKPPNHYKNRRSQDLPSSNYQRKDFSKSVQNHSKFRKQTPSYRQSNTTPSISTDTNAKDVTES